MLQIIQARSYSKAADILEHENMTYSKAAGILEHENMTSTVPHQKHKSEKENIEENLTADARLPSGMKRKGTTLKFGSSLCRKAEPNSSITYLKISKTMSS